ncbi:hypothetical protein [Micromonospora sp. WMMD1082]|uniref:hypothetical protein n=1 Tax=Micromonospora sp. WMMD1082 TaxID=3016104 RepID=UPI0024175FBA|nr:hypothetical protein [Micromonospora sp. WMMD1082]MDG4793426.1 hypothetical protein [Micromonospora sp. WMMD1082]
MTGVADRSGGTVAEVGGIAPLTQAGEHAPVTPDWTCGTCGADWPCQPKRDQLLTEYGADRAMLSVYLGACLAAAAEDLHAGGSTSLQDRFFGWLPRRRRPS